MVLLIAYDGSDPAQNAVEHAIAEHADREMVLLSVIEVSGGATAAGIDLVQEEVKEARGETKKRISAELSDRLDDAGIEFEIETVVGQPAREIVRYAEDHDVEHVVVGNHGRTGLSRVLLGSVAETVVRRASMPVTVVR